MKIPSTRGVLPFVLGAAAGATAAYFYDPERGRARRAIARDRVLSESRSFQRTAKSALHKVGNRMSTLPYYFRSWLNQEGATDDLRLIERVRSTMGRHVSSPGALQVGAFEGEVTLSGPILKAEYEALLIVIRHVPGVRAVRDYLAVYETPVGIPALQAGRRLGSTY